MTVSKTLTIIITLLFISILLFPTPFAQKNFSDQQSPTPLDQHYIFNITKALSNIIFTEYNETQGEVARGRAFGTKGEHKAAEIIKENFTALGLYSYYEQLTNTPKHPQLITKYEIKQRHLNIIFNATSEKQNVPCYIAHTAKGPRNNPNQTTYNITHHNLTIIPKPAFTNPLQYLTIRHKFNHDFVFITEDDSYNPDLPPPRIKQLLGTLFSPYSDPVLFWTWFRYFFELAIWYQFIPHCKGLIRYDFNNDTHNMDYADDWYLPTIFINGSNGQKILNNIDTAKISYTLHQQKNESIISYNVIGQLNGSDPSKTIILDSLYDSVWTQGTADSAIGMAIVMGIAKHYIANNLTPKYTIKFIGFSGEEYTLRGALHYEDTHKNEQITHVIDLNQLGFTQNDPPLYLEFMGNSPNLLKTAKNLADQYQYTNLTGQRGVRTFYMPRGAPSNDQPFARNRFTTRTINVLKGLNWYYHHRDGRNHTEGDVLKYYNETEITITAQIILDLVKSISL